jgi:hypothetical protein
MEAYSKICNDYRAMGHGAQISYVPMDHSTGFGYELWALLGIVKSKFNGVKR